MRSFLLLFILSITLTGLAWAEELTIDENYTINKKLELKVDIDAGEVTIKRNPEARICHVRIDYNSLYARADVRYNEERENMEVLLDYKNWKNIKDHNQKDAPEITIELPWEPVLDMDVELKAGEFNLDLGDLTIKSFQFSNWAGECNIDFDQPNRMEMELLDINFKVGELNIRNLGNARFSQADINSGIGELTIDFNGALLDRSMAKIDLDIGETTITVPEKIGTKLKVSKFLFLSQVSYPNWFEQKGRYYYSDNYNESSNNLYLMISSGIGELSIRVD